MPCVCFGVKTICCGCRNGSGKLSRGWLLAFRAMKICLLLKRHYSFGLESQARFQVMLCAAPLNCRTTSVWCHLTVTGGKEVYDSMFILQNQGFLSCRPLEALIQAGCSTILHGPRGSDNTVWAHPHPASGCGLCTSSAQGTSMQILPQ